MTRPPEDYATGPCQSCGMLFRILDDGTVRMHAIGGGARCDGARLPPASTHSPILDGLIPNENGARA